MITLIGIFVIPIVVGYLYSLSEDPRDHKHFQRVTDLNG